MRSSDLKHIPYYLLFLFLILVFFIQCTSGYPTVKDILEKANDGDNEAQYELGNRYYHGFGVEIDKT